MKIRIFERAKLPGKTSKRVLARAARKALRAERGAEAGELNFIFIGDAEMRRLNKRYLNHDRTTDVLAFGYATEPTGEEVSLRTVVGKRPTEPPAFGDVFISIPQARRQAKALGHSLSRELLTLVLHGTLHLLGHDDRRPRDQARMFARQDELLSVL